MSRTEIKTREIWVDFVRAIAAFMVVYIHAVGPWLSRYKEVAYREWMFANVADSVVRISVPLFFMISGYLLLRHPVSLTTFYKKRVIHVVIPWIMWSIIYCLWNIYYGGARISVLQGVEAFLEGNIVFHFWFIYVLVGLYLLVPVLSWVVDKQDSQRILYFIGVWFLAASFIPLVNKIVSYAEGSEFKIQFDLSCFCGYSGYLVIGLALGRVRITKAVRLCAVALLAGGAAVTVLATAFLARMTGSFSDYFNGYLTPNVIGMSVGSFVLFRELGGRVGNSVLGSKIVSHLSAASFGIYLIHPMFLALLTDGRFGGTVTTLLCRSAFSTPILAGVAFALSYGVVYAILQVPFVRRIV